MSALLITYDLNREVTRPPIVKAIKDKGGVKLSESSYAISTNSTPQQVHEWLKPMLDANDHIYVINLRKPYTGFGPTATNNWLEQNLPG